MLRIILIRLSGSLPNNARLRYVYIYVPDAFHSYAPDAFHAGAPNTASYDSCFSSSLHPNLLLDSPITPAPSKLDPRMPNAVLGAAAIRSATPSFAATAIAGLVMKPTINAIIRDSAGRAEGSCL